MQFLCEISNLGAQGWQGRYAGRELGTVTVTAPTREAVIEKLRQELRYRLEFCPCSGEAYRDISVEVAERPAEMRPTSESGPGSERRRFS